MQRNFVAATRVAVYQSETGCGSIELSEPEPDMTSLYVTVSIPERGDKNINTTSAERQLDGDGQRAANNDDRWRRRAAETTAQYIAN